MSYTIKTLQPQELPILTELFDYHDVEDMIAENTYNIENGIIDIFVLFEEGQLVGELHVKYQSEDELETVRTRRAYLFAFRVREDRQGQGIGKYLLQRVLNLLVQKGYSEFTVSVEDDNARAIHMYRSAGFDEVIARKKESYQGDSYEYNLYLKKGKSMRLRPYRKRNDYEYVQKWITDERTHALWCAGKVPYPLSEAGFHKALEENEKEWGDSAYTFTDDSGCPIGFLSYSINEKDNSGFVKFVVIDPEERGKGYGTQMIRKLLQYAYTVTEVSSVRISVFDVNPGAKKCYENAGFTELQYMPEAFSFRDEIWGRYILVSKKK